MVWNMKRKSRLLNQAGRRSSVHRRTQHPWWQEIGRRCRGRWREHGRGEIQRHARTGPSPGRKARFHRGYFNHRVRLLDLEVGSVSTFAGTGGKAGFGGDGGPASKAKFDQPYTVTLDSVGEKLLIADLGNFRVREIDLKSGTVRTVAGNGKKGMPKDGEPATSQPLVSPRAACYGPNGIIYIASRNGNAVRKVDAMGNIHTIVSKSGKKGYSGDGGPAKNALVNGPKHLCLDDAGNLIITDDVNHCIRLYSPKTGKIHLVAGVPQKPENKSATIPSKPN